MITRSGLSLLVLAAVSVALLSGCAAQIPFLSRTGMSSGPDAKIGNNATPRQSDSAAVDATAASRESSPSVAQNQAAGRTPSVKSTDTRNVSASEKQSEGARKVGEFDLAQATTAVEMRLQPLDSIKVSVWGYPDLDHTAVVQPNGKVTLPLSGEIDAAGATLGELRQRITERLKPFTQVAAPELRIGDTLLMEVWQHAELRATSVIDPLGMVTFPLVGSIRAVGRTVEDIRKDAEQRLRAHLREARATILPTYNNRRVLHDPYVSVLALQLEPRRVAVIGEVNLQGLMEIRGSLRLVEALARAQIRQTTAELNSIVVIRGSGGGTPQYRMIRINDFLDGRAPDQNIYLQNSDIIIVPKTIISRVGDFVEQFFTRTAPIFTWWSALNQATVAKDSAETTKLINESLQRQLNFITISPP
jgi:protein involved in polysaccharide export with SLBB domain